MQKHGVHSFTYAQVDAHFRTEVHWHFSSRIGRAELLNRLGDSIVVFDLLRPEFVWKIGEKVICPKKNLTQHLVNFIRRLRGRVPQPNQKPFSLLSRSTF